VSIRTRLDRQTHVVLADKTQLEQVLMNLVVNARDAMPDGGTLAIETGNTTLGASDLARLPGAVEGEYAVITVSDTGVGMTPEVQRRIFEPFYTTKERGRGTGLGLSVVFGIVQQAEGHIWVDSEPGRGTQFRIYLPRIDAVAAAPSPRRRPVTLDGSETVLVVEDDRQVREVALAVLRRHGYQVIAAGDGDEAQRLCAAHPQPIQLLLTDEVMPGITGRELAGRLRAMRPELKVLCMSGYHDAELASDDIAYLQKPFTAEALARAVRDALDAGRRIPQ
jgi:CheY-like chemotaxis protein